MEEPDFRPALPGPWLLPLLSYGDANRHVAIWALRRSA